MVATGVVLGCKKGGNPELVSRESKQAAEEFRTVARACSKQVA